MVTKTLNTKYGRLLTSNSNKLHQAYKNLEQSRDADYARSHPQMNATLEQWTELIEGRWTNEDWLVNYLCVYYYYPMFTILCCQLIRLILRWSKCILFYSWSNKYFEYCLLEKIKKELWKIGRKHQAKIDTGQRHLLLELMRRCMFFHFLKS